MADKSKTGCVLGPYKLEVSAVKIKELVEAIGDDNPLYLDRQYAQAQGYSDIPCPPTFLTLAFQEFTGAYFKVLEELDILLPSVLHGEEEYEYLDQIVAGDELTCMVTIASIDEKRTRVGALELITLVSRFTNQKDCEVARARSLIIEKKQG